MDNVALSVEIPMGHRFDGYDKMTQIVTECEADDDLFLDVLDAVLAFTAPRGRTNSLRELLEKGGSAWTVNAAGDGLELRVDAAMDTLASQARSVNDTATDELAEAWAKIYGRNPDPSDAWDHAIKAVETVLAPIVVPSNPKATLGKIIAALEDKPSKWSFALNGSSSGGVETLTEMARLMWPNPDRHGGANLRTPALAEAAAVVQLAVLLVQWCRDQAIN